VYYTLQVHQCGVGDPGKWRFTITECVSDGASVTNQRLYFERFFDSQEGAVQYGSMWASVQRAPVIHASAITQLRSRFHGHGFDVSDYSNDQVSNALLQEAATTTPSSVDLFVRAFQRLRRGEQSPPKMPATAFNKALPSEGSAAASVHAQQEQMKTGNADAETFPSGGAAAVPANSAQEKMKTCNAEAKAKGLKGAEREAFMKTCLSGK